MANAAADPSALAGGRALVVHGGTASAGSQRDEWEGAFMGNGATSWVRKHTILDGMKSYN